MKALKCFRDHRVCDHGEQSSRRDAGNDCDEFGRRGLEGQVSNHGCENGCGSDATPQESHRASAAPILFEGRRGREPLGDVADGDRGDDRDAEASCLQHRESHNDGLGDSVDERSDRDRRAAAARREPAGQCEREQQGVARGACPAFHGLPRRTPDEGARRRDPRVGGGATRDRLERRGRRHAKRRTTLCAAVGISAHAPE